MTQIKIEVPANDHIALSAMAEALNRIAAERQLQDTVHDFTDGNPEYVKAREELIKQCEEFKTPKGDDFVEQVDVEIARLDEETKGFSVPENYEESIANFHTLPRSADEPETEQDDTLDADGLPWDKRIHSRGKTRLSDDTWRLARKPNDKTDEEWSAYVESVKSELKAVQDIPTLDETVTSPTIEDVGYDASAPVDDNLTPPEAELTEQQAIDAIGNANDNPMDIVEPTAPTLTPPVIDTDTPQGMSEANEPAIQFEGVTPNGDVAIEPPVTTTGAPVAPVTPPTSLTPPVVESVSNEDAWLIKAKDDAKLVTTFQELMLYMTSNAKKRGADNDMIKATLLEVDPALTAIPLIATRADLIPKFVEALEAKLT